MRPRISRRFVTLLALALTACTSLPPGPTAPPAQTPPPAPTPAVSPGGIASLTLPALLADPLAADGAVVRISGAYWSDGRDQYLADALLESYPPQVGGDRVLLFGEVPANVQARLETTRGQPGVAFVTWGFVEVTGTFTASEGRADPFIEIMEIAVP